MVPFTNKNAWDRTVANAARARHLETSARDLDACELTIDQEYLGHLDKALRGLVIQDPGGCQVSPTVEVRRSAAIEVVLGAYLQPVLTTDELAKQPSASPDLRQALAGDLAGVFMAGVIERLSPGRARSFVAITCSLAPRTTSRLDDVLRALIRTSTSFDERRYWQNEGFAMFRSAVVETNLVNYLIWRGYTVQRADDYKDPRLRRLRQLHRRPCH